MARFNNIYPVDLRKGPAIVPVSAMYYGNAKANRIGAAVTDNGAAVTLSGTCSGTVIRSDGDTVSVSGNVSGNTCYIDLPEAAYAVAGPISIFVTLTSGSVITTLVGAFGTVTSTETGTIAPGTVPDSVAELIAEIEAAVASIPSDYSDMWKTFAPNYSSSTNYTAGAYVTYDGKLYKCTAATTGNFDSTKWTQVAMSTAALLGGALVGSTDLSDANTALTNRIYTVSGSGVSNLPTDVTYGTLISFCYQTGTSINGTAQLFIATDGRCFTRERWGGRTPVWSTWKRCDNGTLETDVSTLQTDVTALNTSVPNIKGAIANEYLSANTYHFGDYVQVDGALYKCKAASTTGTWSSSAWEPTKVANSALMAADAPTSTSVFSDANNALKNRIYTINYDGVSNLPVTNARGTLITFAYWISANTGKTQIFCSSTGQVYSRIYWSSAWTAWSKMSGAISEMGARDGASDFNDMIANRVYTLVNDIDNAPDTSTHGSYGTTLTFNGASQYANGQAQMFVGRYNDIYTRIKWDNSWSPWAKFAKASDTIDLTAYYSGIEMFPRFGVIGDSFASGVIYTGSEEDTDTHHYSLSWPQMLARQSGGIAVNYTRGGMTTKSFITNTTWGLPKLESDISNSNGCGLYLLCLGINDSNSSNTWGGISILGSSSDVNASNPDANADTFWGNYCRIISHIKTAAPASRIVMCTFHRIPTPQTSEGFTPFNQAIEQIAAYNSIPCIKLIDDPFFTSTFYLNNMVGSHPTAPQYVGYAKAIERLLSKCAISNYDYFKVWTNGAPDA